MLILGQYDNYIILQENIAELKPTVTLGYSYNKKLYLSD